MFVRRPSLFLVARSVFLIIKMRPSVARTPPWLAPLRGSLPSVWLAPLRGSLPSVAPTPSWLVSLLRGGSHPSVARTPVRGSHHSVARSPPWLLPLRGSHSSSVARIPPWLASLRGSHPSVARTPPWLAPLLGSHLGGLLSPFYLSKKQARRKAHCPLRYWRIFRRMCLWNQRAIGGGAGRSSCFCAWRPGCLVRCVPCRHGAVSRECVAAPSPPVLLVAGGGGGGAPPPPF